MSRSSRAPSSARREPAGSGALWTAALLALLTLAASADALRIGCFADDFHFLDVARRIPLVRALSGGFGIYPWYRPLSREVFFALIVKFGAAAPLAAHLLSIACLAALAWLTYELACRLTGARAAALAPALLVSCDVTRFLTAWASGFQDLLAATLTLLAVRDHAVARRARSALWIALAPLAKETGFLALPLVLLYAALIEGERRPRRWMLASTLAALAAAALHVCVRLAWRSGGSAAVIRGGPADLLAALGSLIAGFVGRTAVLAPVTLACAALAAWTAWALAARGSALEPSRSGAHAGRFAAAAAVLGLAPLVMGVALHLTQPNAYYAFPAIPWLAVLAAIALGRAPRAARRAAPALIATLVGWNVLALGFRPPAPLEDSSWTFHAWDWREAERLHVVSSRLASDLKTALPVRPESLVVLYAGLPSGSFFQSEDGPASRVTLSDPTVRAYYLNAVPGFIERGRLAVLMFDPKTKRLVTGGMPPAERIRAAATAIFRGQAATAWAYASWADSVDYDLPDRAYARAAARLLARGAPAYRAALAAGGLADSLGARPEAIAGAEFPADPDLRQRYAQVLRSPLSAERHAGLASALLGRGFRVAAGFELRIATTLDPARTAEREVLRELLESPTDVELAR